MRNPAVITDKYLDDGEIVYGDLKTGAERQRSQRDI